MKNFKIFILGLFIININLNSYGQEIDLTVLDKLSPEQIELAKKQLSNSKFIEDEIVKIEESTINKPINNDINKSEGSKYGYNYFTSVPTSISAVGDLPLPNDYKLSLNDQLSIILSGSKQQIFDLNVNLDGSILFPELGSISVAGESFQEVKNKLRNLINQSYIGVEIDISLKNLSAKKVTIVGAVKTPGTYLVNPFSTVSSALAYSGGISEIGTLRNIRLVRANGENFSFDLYKLLIFGDRSDDITIEAGDVIVVDPAEQFINLSGEVKRPAIYEVKYDETLNDLISYGLGLSQIANKSNISMKILDIRTSSIKIKNSGTMTSSLNDVISVIVNPYVSKDISNIYVGGAVKEPGFYDISNIETLEELINRLEFIDVYPWLAILEQFDEDNMVKSSILFSLIDKSTYKEIKLQQNSKLFFANLNERTFNTADLNTKRLISDYTLKINHKQGSFDMPVFGKYSAKSFVDLLGLDMSDVDPVATYIRPLESIVINDDYKNMNFISSKYQNLSFRSPVNDLIEVSISGAVDYPGKYTLKSDSTLQDLYELIGDFKNEAFLSGIIYTKESIRNGQIRAIEKSKADLNKVLLARSQNDNTVVDVNIIQALSNDINPEYLGRVAGDFSPESISSNKTILSNGDSIIVPKIPNTINVLGEVLNPISFDYTDNISVRYAIESAGGMNDFANKRSVYVIKANGIIQKPGRSVFVNNIKLEPGDTIIVPRKIAVENPFIQSLIPITDILSNLAFSAAAIDNLRK